MTKRPTGIPVFRSAHTVEAWLLNSRMGSRILYRLVRKNWRSWMASRLGQRIIEAVRESEEVRKPVVVEVRPDGMLYVWGDVQAIVVNRLQTRSVAGEILDEELMTIRLKGKHREVCGDMRQLAAVGGTRCPSVREEVSRVATVAVSDGITAARRAIE